MYHVKFSFSFQNCIQIFCITFPLLFIFISNCVLVVTIFFHFTFYYVHFTFCIIFMYHSKKLVRLFISHFLVTFIVLSVSFFHFRFISFFSVLFIVVFFLFLFLLFLLSRPRARPTRGQRPLRELVEAGVGGGDGRRRRGSKQQAEGLQK